MTEHVMIIADDLELAECRAATVEALEAAVASATAHAAGLAAAMAAFGEMLALAAELQSLPGEAG